MSFLHTIFASEKEKVQNRIEACQAELAKLPDGYLCQKIIRGKSYLYYIEKVENASHSPKQRILTESDKLTVNRICRRKYLERLIKKLRQFEKQLTTINDNCPAIDEEQINDSLNEIYRRPENLYGFSESNQPNSIKSSTQPYLCENLKHKTSIGLFVRSKSEALIVELLVSHKIPFFYEKPLISGADTYLPDFTVQNKRTGQPYIWEHFGLIQNSLYAEKMEKKLSAYRKLNYHVNLNLLLSYDSEDGKIDIEIIERLISTFLC